eukprot:925737-Prymnesium_polylepis.1
MEPVVVPRNAPRSSVMLLPEIVTVPGIGPKEETAETVKVPFDRAHCGDVDGATVGDGGVRGGGVPGGDSDDSGGDDAVESGGGDETGAGGRRRRLGGDGAGDT